MLESGQFIADNQIVSPLTENQVFELYRVRTAGENMGRLFLLSGDQLPTAKSRQTFLEQAERLEKQTFPGICTLSAAVADKDLCYCLFPEPAGPSLAELLRQPLSTRRGLEFVRGVAERLLAPQEAGEWHGNLSPETLYLVNDTAVIADFALGRLFKLDFHTGADPRYSSPELVRGDALGPAADIYSLGIILYRLLVGSVPFAGDEPFAIAMQHLQGEVPQLPAHLEVFQPLLETLLQPLPGDRISAGELIENLDRLLEMPIIDELDDSQPGKVDLPEDVSAEENHEEGLSLTEGYQADSEMAARIEARLKERAAALQLSRDTDSPEPAHTTRVSTHHQAEQEKNTAMNYSRNRKRPGPVRLFLLMALGIAIGAVLFMVVLDREPAGKYASETDVPEELVTSLEQGRQLLQKDDPQAAEAIFKELIEAYPSFPHPYNNLAVLYAAQGELEQARTYLERALATNEGYATVYRNLGTVYAELARDSYSRALQLEEDRQSVNLQLFAAGGPLPINVEADASGTKATEDAKPAADEPRLASVSEPEADVETEHKAASEEVGKVVQEKAEASSSPESESVVQEEAPPVPEVVLAPEPITAEQFLQSWAEAWSAQNVEAYLSFYADDFVPGDGRSRDAWASLRRSRVSRPQSIEVSLSDFSVVRQQGDMLELEVTQRYKSDRYQDKTRKRFSLRQKGEGWEIVRERSLGRVR